MIERTTPLRLARAAEIAPEERIAWTINETAAYLGIHRRTVERKIKAGVIKATHQLGDIRILRSSVMELFEPTAE